MVQEEEPAVVQAELVAPEEELAAEPVVVVPVEEVIDNFSDFL